MVSTRTGAKKWLGQHWLTDRGILQRIAEAADFGPEDTVIEVGPGRGALTGLLADRASRLIAVEVDVALAETLAVKYRSQQNVSVIEGDVLELTVEEILNRGGGLPSSSGGGSGAPVPTSPACPARTRS